MNPPALRYALRRAGRADLAVEAAAGGVHRVRLPDAEAKNRLLEAVVDARIRADDELELLGARVAGLKRRDREALRRKVGVLASDCALMSNLNVWENIALPALYHRLQPVERIGRTCIQMLEALGADPAQFLAKLPDELRPAERRLAALLRLLVTEPLLALVDLPDAATERAEHTRTAYFEAEYRVRQPTGTLVFLQLAEEDVS